MKLLSLVEFAAEIAANDRALHEMESKIVERAAKMIQKRAKAMIGKEHDIWPELAESTIEDKARHGFKTPAPLLRTGELRDSIEITVSGNEAAVGTNDERGPWFELGTSRMPPRPFLVPAAQASEP